MKTDPPGAGGGGMLTMIRAVIFDLDGTLVQTETLKAESYGEAAVELCPKCASKQEVEEAFRSVVGRSREDVSRALMQRFGLEEPSRERMEELGVKEPWEAFSEVRMRIYEHMLADPESLRAGRLSHNIDLLREVRRSGCKTALATTSPREATLHVLNVLGIDDCFDVIATADDVERTKPDPEVYKFVSRELDVSPNECLAIEDSPPGIQAAVSAGVWCIAVTTDFTRQAVHNAHILDERWIVDDPSQLRATFESMIAVRKTDAWAA